MEQPKGQRSVSLQIGRVGYWEARAPLLISALIIYQHESDRERAGPMDGEEKLWQIPTQVGFSIGILPLPF